MLNDVNYELLIYLGKTLANNEAVVVLGALIKNFTFEMKPNYKFVMEFGVTNRPRGGFSVLLHRR